jgi:hypothetical protein
MPSDLATDLDQGGHPAGDLVGPGVIDAVNQEVSRDSHRSHHTRQDPAIARGVFAAFRRLSTSVAGHLRHGQWIRG